MPREALLARVLVELSGNLVDDFDVVDVLTLLSERCAEVLEVAAAGFMLATPDGELRAVASSSQAMDVVETFELQAEEGPCVDCYRTGIPVLNAQLSNGDHYWPRFSALARESGFRFAHAFPLHLKDFRFGALNLFQSHERQLDEADAHDAQAFANVGAIAIVHHQASLRAQVLNEQLEYVLNCRIAIGQAKGVVAERLGLDLEHAFVRLRQFAHDHDRRLVDVAYDVIGQNLATGSLGQP